MKKKNVLMLIDLALNYVNFFKELALKIDDYAECFYVFESHFPEIRCNSFIESKNKFYYSDYKINKENTNKFVDIYELDRKYNLRKGYFPDFDRHQWFNIRGDLDKRADYEIENLINFYIKIIKENNIEYVMYENVSNIFSYAAYIACQVLNVKYIGFIVSRIPGTHDIWFDRFGNIDTIEKDFYQYNERDIDKETLDFINNYYTNINKEKPEYLKNDIKSYNISYFKYYLKKLILIGRYTNYTLHNKEDRKNSLGMDNPIKNSLQSINRNISRKAKIKYLNMFKSKIFSSVDLTEKYVLYPLHFQPESSTSVNAMYYINQYEVIKNVAFSLPMGITLYVKDHPHAFGYFPLNFYKKISEIPNVKLVHCDENTDKLIKNSEFLVTLTGTMGYEALLNKKPVMCFGEVFYNIHPYCYKIEKYKDVFETSLSILDGQYDKFDEYNKRLIYAYRKNVYKGTLIMYDYLKSDMNDIVKNIIHIISEESKVLVEK